MACAFGVKIHEITVKTNVIKLSPTFSCRSVTVSGLTFKSLIYFELIFTSQVTKGMWIFSFPSTIEEAILLFYILGNPVGDQL